MSCLLNVCKLETLTVGNAFNSLILCQQNKWEGGFQLKWEGGAGGGGGNGETFNNISNCREVLFKHYSR